jgi:hypothetical protein
LLWFISFDLLWFYGLRFHRARQKNPDWLHWNGVQGEGKKDCKYHFVLVCKVLKTPAAVTTGEQTTD